MKFDLHTHHFRCGHAEGSIRDYIEAAIKGGLGVIGISDHSPYFASEEDQFKPGIAMAKSEFPSYIQDVLALREEYAGKIEVLLGVESDFFPEHKELYRAVYQKYPFDYIIGSVHMVKGVGIFERSRWDNLQKEEDIIREKEEYFTLIQQSAKSRMFDILGHIDALRGYFPQLSEYHTPVVDQTLKVIADCSGVIEINTSGKGKDCGGWYPSDEMLERACFYGVKVSFGSDSHVPSRVGDEWENVRTKLKEIGFKQWYFFRRRQPVRVRL
ncbi:histidinol-phosphatase [Paenibacillus thalictri]|uniref:Histidinol-phosphatase n=1 Tax=Paenibacillus thalictri TaxID=2527873 RepID=A0A4Q9DJR9_9BACL|nr:histidinol-phosphatase [Paenibacillus thalictri]TBL74647.1 histidinol-phosphatase HisJ family protein [Paenibacillus thalictri]